jgi:hypothetical protein
MLTAFACGALLHVDTSPPWSLAVALGALIWQLLAQRGRLALPGTGLRVFIALGLLLATVASYRTVAGLAAGRVSFCVPATVPSEDHNDVFAPAPVVNHSFPFQMARLSGRPPTLNVPAAVPSVRHSSSASPLVLFVVKKATLPSDTKSSGYEPAGKTFSLMSLTR